MAVTTLVATAGAANANAYCTLAFADQYHEDRPAVGTTWTDATEPQKNAAILWATTLMDSLWTWNAWTVNVTQILLWPRQGLMKRNQREEIDDTTIPPEIQEATAEYARQLLAGDLAGNSDIETLGITSLKASSVALTFKGNVTAKFVPDTVVNLIPDWWGFVRSLNTGTRDLVRA